MAFQVEKALSHRVVLLAGDEQELCTRALKQLVEAASGDSDFDLEEFDAGSSEPIAWFSSAGTSPFLGERRTAVVRHVLRVYLDKRGAEELKAQVKRQLAALPSTALVILVGDEEAGDDSKQQELKKAQSSWEKVVRDAKGYIELFKFDSKAIPAQVRLEAQALGKKISEKAVMTLVEMTGSSFSRAVEELQKLAIFVGDAAEIRESDVREVATPSREWKVFSLVDSVTSGQPAEALRQLRTLVGSQNKAEDAALRSILPQMSRSLRIIWQARLCHEARCHLGNVPPTVSAQFPEKNNILKEHSFVQEKAMRMAKQLDQSQIAECFECVARADARIKGILDAYSGMDTLERLVLELSNVVTSKSTVRA